MTRYGIAVKLKRLGVSVASRISRYMAEDIAARWMGILEYYR